MAVLALKSEPLCKICKSERRHEIDAILELRSNLTRGDDIVDPETGKTKRGPLLWNMTNVLAQLTEWGLVNMHEDNVKNHWKKHCEVIKDQSLVQAQNAVLKRLEGLQGGEKHADPDEVLRTIVTVYEAELMEKIARGQAPNIPGDLMMKAQQELTRRAHSETQNELMSLFGQGLSAALSRVQPVPALEPAPEQLDVIEAEEADFEEVK